MNVHLLPHEVAAQATAHEAVVERFLDESLISDMSDAMSSAAVDETLDNRREQQLRQKRLHDRAIELMQEELAKERHAKEVRELSDAVSASREPEKPAQGFKGKAAAAAAPDAGKPKARAKEREFKPYVADLTDFVGETEANRSMQALKQENELLKKCMADPKNPRAFSGYLRKNTTF